MKKFKRKVRKKGKQIAIELLFYVWTFKISIAIACILFYLFKYSGYTEIKPTLISGSIALFVLFFKIEWDNFDKARNQKQMNKRLVLAHLIDLYDVRNQLKKYTFAKASKANHQHIDDELRENIKNIITYEKDMKLEIKTALKNIKIVDQRKAINSKLLNTIQSMLIENKIILSKDTYKSLSAIQFYVSWSDIFNIEKDKENLESIIKSSAISIDELNYDELEDMWKQVYKHIKNTANRVIYEQAIEKALKDIIVRLEQEKGSAKKRLKNIKISNP